MAAIILIGLVAGAAVWTSRGSNGSPYDEHGHAEAAHEAHDEHQAHGEHGNRHEPAVTEAEPKPHVGTVLLSPEQVKAAGIRVEAAGPTRIRSSVEFPGEIRFNEDRTAHVVPRLAGVAESVPAALGQEVRKGEVLAVIVSPALSEHRSELLAARQRLRLTAATHEREKQLWQDKISAEQDYQQARAALQEAQIAVENARQKLSALGASATASELSRFELRAPFDGTVVEKHITLGEAVAADTNVFTLSDLSSVWAEFVVSAQDIVKVRVGEKALVSSTAFEETAEGEVSYLGSLIGEQTRTAKARITLTNPNGAWRPGLFVTVAVAAGDEPVPVAIESDALQTLDNEVAVFVEVPGGFAARPVTLGRTDGRQVEVRQGLQAGERYVAGNSFVLKSELGKASAEHSH